MTLTLDDLRKVSRWAAECAGRVLGFFEAKVPEDGRPREAIEGAREFAGGGKRVARLRTLALAALAAAREVDDPAAKAAARSTCLAASAAYTHPLATVDQARHILGPAVYAAVAREQIENVDAGGEEIAWAAGRASAALREILRRFPAQPDGRTRLAVRYRELDRALRG